jgi:glycosyltransferase involved in cell wall biosynthesis
MSETPERPLVSFFVTAYRQEHLVRAAIEGAFAQTYQPLEILLSDDCSPDGTFAVMQAMAAAYSGPHRVILNRNPKNLGITAHVDRIMALTSGDFVVQNAGDDVSVPERAERLVAAWLGSGRRAKAIHSARRRLDPDGGLHEVIDDGPRILAGLTPLQVIRDHGTLVGAGLGWDRDIWRVFGPLGSTPVFDDFPTAFRASLIGEIAYLPEPLLHYRTGGTSSRPKGDHGHNYLYGFRIKDLRWHRSFWRAYLEAIAVVAPPDAAECRRLLEAKIAAADFAIGLAETPWWRLPLRLPAHAALSLARRDPHYLRETAKYLLGPLYARHRDRAVARRRTDVAA